MLHAAQAPQEERMLHAAQAPQEERMLHAAQGHTKVKQRIDQERLQFFPTKGVTSFTRHQQDRGSDCVNNTTTKSKAKKDPRTRLSQKRGGGLQ